MARKNYINLSKSDFDIDDNEYLFTFTDEAISDGKCLAQFTFDPDEDLSSHDATSPILKLSTNNSTNDCSLANSDTAIIINNNDDNTAAITNNNNAGNIKNSNIIKNTANQIINSTSDSTEISCQNISQNKYMQINTYAEKLFDNRTISIPNGASPPINGETPTIRRSYIFRASTIRKLNELKSIHPDINACVSTIVDVALEHYYAYITKQGGSQ